VVKKSVVIVEMEDFFIVGDEVALKAIDVSVVPPTTPQKDPTAKKPKTVSFSQYAMWLKCPFQWKLSYMDKLSTWDDSINTAFGKAIHTVLQNFLNVLYTKGAIEAEAIDCVGQFNTEYDKEIKTIREKETKGREEEKKKALSENREHVELPSEFIDVEIEEFRVDGKNIIDYFVSHSVRSKHFPSKIYEIVGIELPLNIPIRGGTIIYKGFLDIVLREKSTGKIRILDFKTSTFGWNKYQKADRTKLDQLLLYKRFYNQVYKTPLSDIEVEFIILKRRLYEDLAFPQQRIQRVAPPDGKMSLKMVEESFLDFINECFDAHGEYNKESPFGKNPGKAKKNCKYCSFKDMVNTVTGEKYCDGKEG
jgi:hypothetical protein